jgi:glutamyl-queuosine tRNA(Asp) synthetase
VTYVGRYAPSPTGDLHLGNALAAVCAWARARRAGGRCLLRIEDLDTKRLVAGATERMLDDLFGLGLAFDGVPLVQSQHLERYHDALARLRDRGLVYACRCSRQDLLRAASAPHEGEEGPPYPGTCRDQGLPFDDPVLPVAWRFRVDDALGPTLVTVEDALQGRFTQDVAAAVGDFVVKRKDGLIAYQLAVVVDDMLQGVSEVVRGRDLLSSAPRQVLLFRALGAVPPRFAHVPLWVDAEGQRVSKRSGASLQILRSLYGTGVTPAQALARIGAALGVCPAGTSLDAHALAGLLDDAVLARPAIAEHAGAM